MNLCIIGTGYVGLVSGACMADVGNTVYCVDKNESKISSLKKGVVPIYEPGLNEVVRRNEEEGRLFYTTNLSEGLKSAEICFITVDTPPDGDGRADLTNVLAVAKEIGNVLDHPVVVVTKSTVPVGTTILLKEAIAKGLAVRGLDPQKLLSVASNPEFLKEGCAVADFMKPDRVIVGAESDSVSQKLHKLYSPFMLRQDRFIRMSIASAELSKYAANAMLATRISFMNEMARLCEKAGADINDIRKSLGSDPRIGPDFLYAGLGFGGSCLPKDMKAVIELGKEHGARLNVVEAAEDANDRQREWFWNKIVAHFRGETGIRGKRIAIWGVAFKAATDDVRFAASLHIINKLLAAGAVISVFDPVAGNNCRTALGRRAEDICWTMASYDAIEGADALIICTEWREFRSPDFKRMKTLMRSPVIFDGRNLYDLVFLINEGFTVYCVGRTV